MVSAPPPGWKKTSDKTGANRYSSTGIFVYTVRVFIPKVLNYFVRVVWAVG